MNPKTDSPHYYSRVVKWINIKAGMAGGISMGLIVLFINADHGWQGALTASVKQAAYTFLFGGMLVSLVEYLVVKVRGNRAKSILVSSVAVSLLTISMVYLVHSLRGTPKPFLSTLPTILLAPPSLLLLAWRKRILSERATRRSEQVIESTSL